MITISSKTNSIKVKIVFSALLATTLAISLCQSQNLQCVDYNGVRTCTAGIQSTILDAKGFDTQHMNEWCWAASIQAVFDYYGHNISQERIVQETFGSIGNWPAQPYTILQALNRTWKDDNGTEFASMAESYDANLVTAAQDLASDYPLIIGANGHAMVLTALTYSGNMAGQVWIQSATVRDPWPLNPSRRDLTFQEWMGISFLARIRITN